MDTLCHAIDIIYILTPGLLVRVVSRHVAVAHEPGVGRAGEHRVVLARRAGDGLRCTRFARDLHNLATLRISSPSRCRGSSEASSSPSELESLAPAAAASRWDSTREAEERIVVTWNRTYLCLYIQLGQLRLNPPGLGSKCGKRVERFRV